MNEFVRSAVLVDARDDQALQDRFRDNPHGVSVHCTSLQRFAADAEALRDAAHVVVHGDIDEIKTVLDLSVRHGFSVGLMPPKTEKTLIRNLDLPLKAEAATELALRQSNLQPMDLVRCNGHILLFRATIGRIPLLDAAADRNRAILFVQGMRRCLDLKLLRFEFTTASERSIRTAASGCMILHHNQGNLASRITRQEVSVADGSIPVVITAPFSILDYLHLLVQTLIFPHQRRGLPSGIGLVKSSRIRIESDPGLEVSIDGKAVTRTPLICEVAAQPIRINVGPWLAEVNRDTSRAREKVRIDNIPNERERDRSAGRHIPLFSYASEQRFRELFTTLREDARINPIYIVLMVLSTLLATIGLYMGSSAVIIGAMVLAPMMAPIVSLAMGLLRRETALITGSSYKILAGILIALCASALVTLAFPHKPITGEMLSRLNPSLLDLGVAIVSGIAAAYSMSYREIIQSLAGIAIAVALVPPLSVAGIGLGRGDIHFFNQAFLLFSTNLVGIALAATFTFRVLGYSAIVRSRRGIGIALMLMMMLSVPLYFSYQRIVEQYRVEKNLKSDRYLVNGKYIIVHDAGISRLGDKKIIDLKILARESLSRSDLNLLKRKIQRHFDHSLTVRTSIIYIL